MIKQDSNLRHEQDFVMITCALTGVLTDPKQHPVPVTPQEMSASAKQAYDQGASIMHVHFRSQESGKGHFHWHKLPVPTKGKIQPSARIP